ncbi:Essential protein Yae1 N-terminal protein [Dioscorea alata]|uniref:Essential protein Yae1 N-terminal protein n=2 Tax=Dioscorea alata TaxID=55571 RepID=A0ACB7VX88_DIOAL|nr:Essential protein Yae1 N-terminal protein [Dioscorea alata]KAH7679331.1 Essential protein Yae1 N-terminal protein [Dioscorea alata]
MEGAGPEQLQPFTGSVEHPNAETSFSPAIPPDQSNAHDDGSDDLWWEDENEGSDDGFSHASILNREWQRRHKQFHTMGYRDGIAAGKEASAQEGFNEGFKQSVHIGYNWGLVRGIASTLSSLSDNLKGKLVGDPEKRESFQNLYSSVQKVSTNDALKMFHDSIKHSGSTQSIDLVEDFQQLTVTGEGIRNEQLDTHFKKLMLLISECPEIKVTAEIGHEMVGQPSG